MAAPAYWIHSASLAPRPYHTHDTAGGEVGAASAPVALCGVRGPRRPLGRPADTPVLDDENDGNHDNTFGDQSSPADAMSRLNLSAYARVNRKADAMSRSLFVYTDGSRGDDDEGAGGYTPQGADRAAKRIRPISTSLSTSFPPTAAAAASRAAKDSKIAAASRAAKDAKTAAAAWAAETHRLEEEEEARREVELAASSSSSAKMGLWSAKVHHQQEKLVAAKKAEDDAKQAMERSKASAEKRGNEANKDKAAAEEAAAKRAKGEKASAACAQQVMACAKDCDVQTKMARKFKKLTASAFSEAAFLQNSRDCIERSAAKAKQTGPEVKKVIEFVAAAAAKQAALAETHRNSANKAEAAAKVATTGFKNARVLATAATHKVMELANIENAKIQTAKKAVELAAAAQQKADEEAAYIAVWVKKLKLTAAALKKAKEAAAVGQEAGPADDAALARKPVNAGNPAVAAAKKPKVAAAAAGQAAGPADDAAPVGEPVNAGTPGTPTADDAAPVGEPVNARTPGTPTSAEPSSFDVKTRDGRIVAVNREACYLTDEDETTKSVAKSLGSSVDDLVAANVHRCQGLGPGSKFKKGTRLLMPASGSTTLQEEDRHRLPFECSPDTRTIDRPCAMVLGVHVSAVLRRPPNRNRCFRG